MRSVNGMDLSSTLLSESSMARDEVHHWLLQLTAIIVSTPCYATPFFLPFMPLVMYKALPETESQNRIESWNVLIAYSVQYCSLMTDFIGLFCELVTDIIVLITQPFSLLKLISIFGARTICLVTHMSLLLMKAIIHFQVDICSRMTIWAVSFVSLPMRVLTALQRERMLEMHLHEMQIELENLACDKKELEEQLHVAIKDRKIMESILEEFEEEHEKAIGKIELLEAELQDLEVENLRLKEIQGKNLWNLKVQDDTSGCRDIFDLSSLKSGYNSSGVIIQDLMHKDAWEGKNKGKYFKKIGSTGSVHDYPFGSLVIDEAVDQRRGVALSQSLFSAILSLLVGMIIWEAEDPCMPLVIALFSVVGMSLKSVVQFFSTIKNRPASDAVALLSFNWFILGTLTYPTLPRVAHLLSPLSQSLANTMVSWLGLSVSQ